MLSVASNDGELFAVFAQCVELIGERCLELLARDVGELSLSDQRFGFSAHEFLLKYNDLRAVRLFVFELRDFIGYLLFS